MLMLKQILKQSERNANFSWHIKLIMQISFLFREYLEKQLRSVVPEFRKEYRGDMTKKFQAYRFTLALR